jgi:hypothetical protein
MHLAIAIEVIGHKLRPIDRDLAEATWLATRIELLGNIGIDDEARWCTNPWDSTVASSGPASSRHQHAEVSGTRGRMAALSSGR